GTSEFICNMSITPSTTLESPLTSTWGPTIPYHDGPLVMPGYTSRLWSHDSQPQFWSKYQVWEWLQQVMDIHQIDASSIPFQNFDMDGHQLCSLNYHDFIRAAGSVGHILYNSITELKSEIYDPSVHPLAPNVSPTPSSPGKKKKMFYATQFTCILSDIKRSFSRSHQVKKHNPRGTHLWEFIRDILLNPERNPGLIKWEDRTEGVFRFLKSEAVAQLWGKKKNNSSMTYEKLSRAMRYYYKREILERVDGRRLVYKFGRNARGWREAEK
uniref:ETS homologous factor n=1 Tax=Fundulus heteroclitus TaxID=8078 RepID=A0A3Q2P9J3_FUNHE